MTRRKAAELREPRPMTEHRIGQGLPCPICTGRTYRAEVTVGEGRDALLLMRDRCCASTQTVREWIITEPYRQLERIYGPR